MLNWIPQLKQTHLNSPRLVWFSLCWEESMSHNYIHLPLKKTNGYLSSTIKKLKLWLYNQNFVLTPVCAKNTKQCYN
jgi:hypothetical protein